LRVKPDDAANLLYNHITTGKTLLSKLEEIRPIKSEKGQPLAKVRKAYNSWIDSIHNLLNIIYPNSSEYKRHFNYKSLDINSLIWSLKEFKPKRIQFFKSNAPGIMCEMVQKEREKIEQELEKKALEDIKNQWAFERRQTIRNLEDSIEERQSFLTERVRYINEFGGNPNAMSLEIPLLNLVKGVKIALKKYGLNLDDVRFSEEWIDRLDNKFKESGIDPGPFLLPGMFNCSEEVRKAGNQLYIDFLRENLNRPLRRKVIISGSVELNRDHYNSICDMMIELNDEFANQLKLSIGNKIKKLEYNFRERPPKYIYHDLRQSFDQLSDYISDLVMHAERIPGILNQLNAANNPIAAKIMPAKISSRLPYKLERDAKIFNDYKELLRMHDNNSGKAYDALSQKPEYPHKIKTLQNIVSEQRRLEKPRSKQP
jgi:hypothetical protein